MIEKVQALLQEFEDKLASGKVVTFTVEISPEGMYVQPEPKKNNEAKRVHLSSEFIKTFEVFFSDAKEIRCNSPQYLTLKSLINTQCTIDRMAHPKDQK